MALLKENILKGLNELSDRELDLGFHLREALTSPELKDREAYTDGLISSEALYTSYRDFYQIYQDLIERREEKKIESFADLGAGISRSKILFDLLEAPFQTMTYEFVPERVEAAKEAYQKLKLPHVKGIIKYNLKEKALPSHDAYFLYLPVGPTLDHLVEELKNLSLKKSRLLYVIESHGDLLNYLKKCFPDLKELSRYPLHSQRHDPNLYVFELDSCKEQIKREKEILKQAKDEIDQGFFSSQLEPFELYTLLKAFGNDPLCQIIVREEQFSWLASIEGWKEGPVADSIESLFPPRIIPTEQIEGLVRAPTSLGPYIARRRSSEESSSQRIRKIVLDHPLSLEFADGHFEKVPLSADLEDFLFCLNKKRGP